MLIIISAVSSDTTNSPTLAGCPTIWFNGDTTQSPHSLGVLSHKTASISDATVSHRPYF